MTTETLIRERSRGRRVGSRRDDGRDRPARPRGRRRRWPWRSAEAKNAALRAAAAAVRSRADEILAANADDLAAARERRHRLRRCSTGSRSTRSGSRRSPQGLEDIAALPDPVGRVLAEWTRPNGLDIARVSVPLGVIGIIYESRPNVTADAGGLALKSGNAAILRGGSESFHSSRALVAALRDGLRAAGLPEDAIQLVPTRDRAAVGMMLDDERASSTSSCRAAARSLIERVQRESRIPVIAHLEGLCHTYVDGAADPEKARAIVLNAKMRRVSICGATETLLVDRARRRHDHCRRSSPICARPAASCAATREVRAIDPARRAGERSRIGAPNISTRSSRCAWSTASAEAIAHIERYGSHHTDAIVTEDSAAAERFLREVDSAIVLVNASTQFADGGEFGMGAEIGISTQRLPPRGPVGAAELTTYKYLVRGNGQVRP